MSAEKWSRPDVEAAVDGATRAASTQGQALGVEHERARVTEIHELGRRHGMTDLAHEHIRIGTPLELFRGVVLDAMERRGGALTLGAQPGYLGWSKRERGAYSLTRFIRAAFDTESREYKEGYSRGGLEFEISDEIMKRAQRAGIKPSGNLCLPLDLFVQRDVDDAAYGMFGNMARIRDAMVTRTLTSTGGVGTGGALVQSTVMGSQYVPPNYNVPCVVAAGARVLSGLQGNVQIPAMTAGKSWTWVNPENTAVASADPTFAQIPLTPKDVGTVVDISRRLLLQSTPAVDGLIRDDIAMAMANTIDAGAITGTGASGQPLGLLNNSNVPTAASLGTNGGSLNWSALTYLPQLVGTANRLLGSLAFLTNAQAALHANRTQRISGSIVPKYLFDGIDENGLGGSSCLGYPVHISQNVPSNLTKGSGTNLSPLLFGNWNDLLIGEWGVLSILADPYTFSNTGALRITAFATVDVNVRYPQGFAKIVDIVTT
jgi:HK97 family phage major capsid protein